MTAVVQALSAALNATEEQQFAVCEALALAPRELLSEEYLYMSSGMLSQLMVPSIPATKPP